MQAIKLFKKNQRIKVKEVGQTAMQSLYSIGAYLKKSSIGQQLLDLIYMRVSQMNRCAFCLDMHSKDLRAKNETEQRIYTLNAWRDTPFFSDKERAALSMGRGSYRLQCA